MKNSLKKIFAQSAIEEITDTLKSIKFLQQQMDKDGQNINWHNVQEKMEKIKDDLVDIDNQIKNIIKEQQ